MLNLMLIHTLQNAAEGATIIAEQLPNSTNVINTKDVLNYLFQLFITVIGFIFALWNERRHDEVKKKKDTKELKRLLKDELNRIKDILENLDTELLEVQPLKTPMWESVISTGQLSLLDFMTREELFRVYGKIKEYNSWASIYTNYYFEKDQKNQVIINELNEIKNELTDEHSAMDQINDRVVISSIISKL